MWGIKHLGAELVWYHEGSPPLPLFRLLELLLKNNKIFIIRQCSGRKKKISEPVQTGGKWKPKLRL